MTLNVLVRTSNRPKFFQDCIRSIKAQNYPINLIVANDANDSYCKPYNPIKVTAEPKKDHRIDGARHFPFNSYLNEMFKHCKEGYVLILDDDDVLEPGAVQKIMKRAQDDRTVFWRVKVGERIIPSDINWARQPAKRDISMIGFVFSTKYLPLIHISPYKQADWRLALMLYNQTDSDWIDQVLTKTQREHGDGMGLRKDKGE